MSPSRPRIVVDTSVLISAAFFPNSTPLLAVEQAARQGDLLRSGATFQELEHTLRRAKFDRYASLEAREAFLDWLHGLMQFVTIRTPITACRDPRDDKFLELAVNGRADPILSSDHDLLVLDPFQGIPILTPASYLDTPTVS